MTKNRFVHDLAIALEYNQNGESAPIVGAKGEKLAADEIVKIAKRFGVPVVNRRSVARALAGLELDQEIPPELFEAVALVLNQIDKKRE
jgi:type III secretion system FlhB-like substrate exporter